MTKKPKLTDLDLVLLSGAAARPDGMLLPPPESVRARGKTLEKALAKLLRLQLVEECPTTTLEQSWREGDDGRGVALRISDPGREARRSIESWKQRRTRRQAPATQPKRSSRRRPTASPRPSKRARTPLPLPSSRPTSEPAPSRPDWSTI